MIKDVKVWSNATKTEYRIYVHTTDNREGCKYLTGNHWHPTRSVEGTLTDKEWAEAKQIAIWENSEGRRVWHTVYENEMADRLVELGMVEAVKPEPETNAKNAPAQTQPHTRNVRRNRRGQWCWKCGRWVPASQGELFFVQDDDEAMYGFQAGWLVECHDGREECDRLVAEARAEAKAKREANERNRTEQEAKLAAMTDEERESFWPRKGQDRGTMRSFLRSYAVPDLVEQARREP